MKLYSERFKDVELCNIPTYDEILTVKNGFVETELPNSIIALKSTQWGFIEVVGEPKVEEPKVEEPKVEEPKIETPVVVQKKKKSESAMTVSDVDAILGSKKASKPRKFRK